MKSLIFDVFGIWIIIFVLFMPIPTTIGNFRIGLEGYYRNAGVFHFGFRLICQKKFRNKTKKKESYASLTNSYVTSPKMIIDFEQKRLVDLCKEVDAHVEKTYPDLLSRRVTYYEDSSEKIIVTSDAADGHVSYPRCGLYVSMSKKSANGGQITPISHLCICSVRVSILKRSG